MHRRQYLVGIGASLGLGDLRPLGGRRPARLERVRPVEGVAVRPGTTVLFELSVPDGVEPHDVEWEADGDDDVGGSGVALDYAFATGNAAYAPTFESRGTYEVRATLPGNDPATWTVEVDRGENGPPALEALRTEPTADETVGVDHPIEVTATVSDPAGGLDQVIWIEGRNETVVDRSSVSGTRDTAALELAETPRWIDYGYPTAARVVCGDGRVSDYLTDEGPTVRQPLEVAITGTNDPVAAGERLAVTAEIENVGDVMMVGPDTQPFELVVGGEVVDAETATVPWNETATITLSYETYPVRRPVAFPVEVRGEDDADEVTVAVSPEAEPSLEVAIVGTGDPVTGGEYLGVTADVANAGTARTTEDVRLAVADDVVDSQRVTLEPGEHRTVSLGYETYPVRRDVTFPVTVTAGDDADRETVAVRGRS